jgi:hypothetical protein
MMQVHHVLRAHAQMIDLDRDRELKIMTRSHRSCS